MVTELQAPGTDGKGLLVFTHKERPWLLSADPGLRSALRRLRNHYIVLMHWGWYHRDLEATPFIDAHLAGPHTIGFRPGKEQPHIPLCSRDFLPDLFRPMPKITPRWDVLCVARPVKFKHMHDLLVVTRRVLDSGVPIRVRLHCVVPRKLQGPQWDRRFFRYHDEAFTDEERRENVRLDMPVHEEGLFPLTQEEIVERYNAARTFALFSKREGESRVLHEALLCGRPVVVRSDLLGGGLDHLDETNSLQFADLDEAVEVFARIHEGRNLPRPDVESLRAKIGEAAGIRRLRAALESLCEELDEPFADRLDTHDLMNRLPSHSTELPDRLRSKATDDLRSPHAMYRYVLGLLQRVGDGVGPVSHVLHHTMRPVHGARRGVQGMERTAYGLKARFSRSTEGP